MPRLYAARRPAIGMIIVAMATIAMVIGRVGAADPPGAAAARFTYAGDVVDERGAPVAGADVVATHAALDGHSYGYIGTTTTDAAGHFSIDRAVALSGITPEFVGADVLRLGFSHPDFVYGGLGDLSLLPAGQRARLRVTLRAGRTVRGRVVDPAGRPVEGAAVRAVFGERYEYRKATVTDARGEFRLRGLPEVDAAIQVIRIGQPGATPVSGRAVAAIGADDRELLTVRAAPVALPAGGAVRHVLGMAVVDVDKALQGAMHLHYAYGVLVLDPGPDAARLGLPDLRRGDVIWHAGDAHVHDARELAAVLIAAGEGRRGTPGGWSCGVVYNFDHGESAGSYTGHLSYTDADLAALRATFGW